MGLHRLQEEIRKTIDEVLESPETTFLIGAGISICGKTVDPSYTLFLVPSIPSLAYATGAVPNTPRKVISIISYFTGAALPYLSEIINIVQ